MIRDFHIIIIRSLPQITHITSKEMLHTAKTRAPNKEPGSTISRAHSGRICEHRDSSERRRLQCGGSPSKYDNDTSQLGCSP